MPFAWPRLSEITYRFWRLRRLIAVAALLPFVIFALTGLMGWGVASDLTGLTWTLVFLVVLMSAHAILFPNAYQETLALSVVLALIALFSPLISGSIAGWFLFTVIVGVWFLWFGQNHILGWSMRSKPHQPVLKTRIRTKASVEAAREWFPLRPDKTRGQYRCGSLGEEGTFPVWFEMQSADILADLMPGYADQTDGEELPHEIETEETDIPASFYARIETDEADHQRTQIFERPDVVQAIVEHHITPLKSGALVTETETPTTYPRGQTLTLWLNDYQTDGLVHLRDLLEERPSHAIRAANRWSIQHLVSKWLIGRFMRRGYIPGTCAPSQISELSEEKLSAFLERLGSDFVAKGYSTGPMPLVTLEEFFDGNTDDGSFQGASVDHAREALQALRDRADVADIRMGITQWEGPSSWPLAEYLYFITSAEVGEVKKWLTDAGILVSEMASGGEHRPREELSAPDGHRVVWAWID